MGLILFLASVVLFGALGGFIARRDGLPVVAGVLIGAVFNVLGVVFLAGVWLAEHATDKLENWFGAAR